MTGLYGRLNEGDREYCCNRARSTNNERHDLSCKNWKPEHLARRDDDMRNNGGKILANKALVR